MAAKKKSKKKIAKKKVAKKKAKKKAKPKKPHNPKFKLPNAKYEHFCQVYIIHYNATAAYRTACGRTREEPLPGDAEQGSRLLRNVDNRARIEHLEDLRTERTKLDQDKILSMLSNMATADITEAFDEDGNLLPLREIPKNVRLLINGLESAALKDDAGVLSKIKVIDRLKAIELAGKHVKVQAFKEKVDITGKLSLADLVAGADDDGEK